jgi:hypothetical protein
MRDLELEGPEMACGTGAVPQTGSGGLLVVTYWDLNL